MSLALQAESLSFTGSVNGFDYFGILRKGGAIQMSVINGTRSGPSFEVNNGELDSLIAALQEIKARFTGQFIVNEFVDQSSQMVGKESADGD